MNENHPRAKRPSRSILLTWLIYAAAIFLPIFVIGYFVKMDDAAEWAAASFIIATVLGTGLLLVRMILTNYGSWRTMRRVAFSLACLATVVAVLYVEENVRGHHAWIKCQSALKSQGLSFDMQSLVPTPVSDEQNVAMTPIWVEAISAILGPERAKVWYGDKVDALGHTNFVNRLSMSREVFPNGPDVKARMGDWNKAEKTDLSTWQQYYREAAAITNSFPVPPEPKSPAEDVLMAWSIHDKDLEELRQAFQRPESRFPVRYDDEDPASILLPHLAPLKGVAQTLALRAVAELQADRTSQALQDFTMILRLNEAIRSEPFLISHLVRLAIFNIGLQPVWEGLVDGRWTDDQLAELMSQMAALNFLSDYQTTIRSEMAFAVSEMDFLRYQRQRDFFGFPKTFADRHEMFASHADHEFPPKDWIIGWLVNLMPSGWFDQNKCALAQSRIKLQLSTSSLQAQVIPVKDLTLAFADSNQPRLKPFGLLTSYFQMAFEKVPMKFARGQSNVDLARVACALERYRLVHETFPHALAELAPTFIDAIPSDVIDGQPLRYRHHADGGYVLYSIGWNQTDEGGHNGQSIDEGDWVWTMPGR